MNSWLWLTENIAERAPTITLLPTLPTLVTLPSSKSAAVEKHCKRGNISVLMENPLRREKWIACLNLLCSAHGAECSKATHICKKRSCEKRNALGPPLKPRI